MKNIQRYTVHEILMQLVTTPSMQPLTSIKSNFQLICFHNDSHVMSMNLLFFNLKSGFPHISSHHIFNILFGQHTLPFIKRIRYVL